MYHASNACIQTKQTCKCCTLIPAYLQCSSLSLSKSSTFEFECMFSYCFTQILFSVFSTTSFELRRSQGCAEFLLFRSELHACNTEIYCCSCTQFLSSSLSPSPPLRWRMYFIKKVQCALCLLSCC